MSDVATLTTRRALDSTWRAVAKIGVRMERLRDNFAISSPEGLEALEKCEERADDLLAAIEHAREVAR